MPKTKTFVIFGIAVLTAATVIFRYMNDFSRLKKVEIGTTPIALGTISNVVLTNNQSSKVDFTLHCYPKVRSGGKEYFAENIHIPPNGSVEFNANPELSGLELPRMIPNKACEAVWHGPLGIRRSAWWLSWQYFKAPHKVAYP